MRENGDKCLQTFKNEGPITDSYLPPLAPKCSLCQETRSFFLEQSVKCVFGREVNCIQAGCQAPQWWYWDACGIPCASEDHGHRKLSCLLLVVTSGQAAADPQQRLVIWDGIQSRKQEEASRGSEVLTVRWHFAVVACRRKSCHLGKSPHLFPAVKPWNHSFSRVYLNFNTWLILSFIMKMIMLCKVLK